MKPKHLFLLILILVCPFLGNGQVYVNCCGIKQPIPQFTGGDRKAIVPEQLLVDRKVLQPISSSAAEAEIRIIYFQNIHQITTVIKCINNAVDVTLYDAFVSQKATMIKEELSNYIDLGSYKYNNDTSFSLFYKKVNGLKPASNLSWNEVFAALVKNHFFDMPSQADIDKAALKYNPKAHKPLDGGSEWFEIKIGDHYRYFQIGNDYDGVPAIAKYTRYKQNILKLLIF